MVGQMENVGGDACEAAQCAKRASLGPLFPSAGHGTRGSPAAPLERGEVHRLPDVDPTARLTRHQVLQDPTTNQLETRRLGGKGAHNDGEEYSVHLRSVSLHHLGGGLTGAQG